MASFLLNGSSMTARTLANNEIGIIGPNGVLAPFTGDAIASAASGDNIRVSVAGSITSNADAGINASGRLDVAIAQSGSVLALGPGAPGIFAFSAEPKIINNAGMIAGGNAVSSITSGSSGSIFLTNSGMIQGVSAINLNMGDSESEIVNSGSILGTGSTIIVSGTADDLLLTNTGTISSVDGTVISLGTVYAGTIINAGLISTTANSAMTLSNESDEVINSGTIQGRINLLGSSDIFDGRGGSVAGDVRGGTGDDTYIIDDSDIALVEFTDQGTDTVQSAADAYALAVNFENLTLIGAEDIDGTGNDAQNTIEGNAGDNKLTGLGSRDTINGHAGDDAIDAGRGNDVVDGGEGDDAIAGRAGDDILNGGNGSDFIFGGIGSDTINGGSGDDRIKGGAARDELTGAAGSDTFIFCSVTDSTLGPGSDRISDFEVGNDKLDFTNLISGQLTLASGSHTGGGTASVFTSTTGSGNTNVLVDVDGDGSSDMRVVLLGSSGLTETDFIL